MVQQGSSNKHMMGRLLLFVFAALMIMALIMGRKISNETERVIFGKREVQIDAPYAGSQPVKLPPTLIVAHNAGDQKSTVQAALDHGAIAIEIDVRMIDGSLYAAHNDPPDIVPKEMWEMPELGEAWQYTGSAEVLKLDLKSTDQHALEALVQFVKSNPTDRQIIIVSKDPAALQYFEKNLPGSIGLYSVTTAKEINALLGQSIRPEGINGISVPAWLLNEARVRLLREHGYFIDAWSVNDPTKMVELTSFGVDIITTDNLAFFEMLVGTPVVTDSA